MAASGKARVNMQKYKCVIRYDGTNFAGFQIQPNERTIHGEIEKALRKLHKGQEIRIQASGRTDAGVHALGQTFHFETDLDLPLENWSRALNTLLPEDIYMEEITPVERKFHVRYDATMKEYRYYVQNTLTRDVFNRNYRYHFPYQLDVKKIEEACTYFEGKHDFTTFSSRKATTKGSKVRTLYEVTCHSDGENLEFVLRGNGFLYHMVRIIIGVLLDVGQGRRAPEDIPFLLKQRDRQLVGETVPASGLYLWEVMYDV